MAAWSGFASYPKSGNTWVRAFLHNMLHDAKSPANIESVHAFCRGDTDAEWFEQFTDKPYDQLSKAEQAALRPKVHALLTRASPDSVFVKTRHFLGEARHGFRERSEVPNIFFRRGTSGQWKTAPTPEQVARIERDQRQQMQRFGYLRPGY